MAYVGLNRVETVPYRGTTDGMGEAYVEVTDVRHDSQGHAHVSTHHEWRYVQCRNVPYSGAEEVEITINVDDDAFNNKVDQTAGSVHAVSGTVGLFQAAQVHQVSENAIKIAQSLKDGFDSVVAAEISQQIGVVEERSKNSYQLLQTYKKHMDDVSRTMEKDYADIKGRNVKQFDSINKQYTDMIHALDAASFSMAKDLEASMKTYAELSVATQALLPEESSITRNSLEVSQLNGSSEDIINSISKLLKQNNAYNAFVQGKISSIPAEKEEIQSLPVLFLENDALNGDYVDSSCFMQFENDETKKSIEESVKSALHCQESVIEDDYQECLEKKISVSNLNERELSVIRSLMDGNRN